MSKGTEAMTKILDMLKRFLVARKSAAIRVVFSLGYLLIDAGVKAVIAILACIQFIYALVTTRHNEAVRSLSQKLTTYDYRLTRYYTLNESTRPYPLGKFPEELEPSESVDFSSPPETETGSSSTGASGSAESPAESDDDVQEAIILDHKSE